MKVYFPVRYLDVPASPPHEGNPAYRVSRGSEHWSDGNPQWVYKIQMAYNGQVHGRKSPSFPEGTNDFERVMEAMQELRNGGGLSGRGMVTSVGPEPGLSAVEAHQLMADHNPA